MHVPAGDCENLRVAVEQRRERRRLLRPQTDLVHRANAARDRRMVEGEQRRARGLPGERSDSQSSWPDGSEPAALPGTVVSQPTSRRSPT